METGDYFPDPDLERYCSVEDSTPEDGDRTANNLPRSVLRASAQMVIHRGDRIDVVGNGNSPSTTSTAVADSKADEFADADSPEVKSRGETCICASRLAEQEHNNAAQEITTQFGQRPGCK